ncbi:hypothetical protein [Methylophilus sp. 14]|uniref:hypothetical protein n=1 Tax=Methylophilus sp. 14 TaxID=2781019 RepID=UPI00188FD72D|nr:hypothetical protein [Methylophilus sp. 14]MBF4988101.1 hypothetical protein [Methylophilus sp. 14]
MTTKTMTVLRSILILSSWLFATMAMAEEFNAKEAFRAPVPVPGPIIAYVSNELGGNQLAACHEIKALDLFEAQLVSLNASTKAYLVKPARMCLCGGDECPLWLFKAKSKVTKPIWHTNGASMVEVMDKKLNGYLKLKESGSAAANGHEAMYGWDRNSYTEIYANVWTWDAEKNCRVGKETTQLMDGTMVHHTKKCIQDGEKPALTTP